MHLADDRTWLEGAFGDVLPEPASEESARAVVGMGTL
jgi:hypothetical protein